MPRQREHAGAILLLQGDFPALGGFDRVAGAHHQQVGNDAEALQVLDRLLRQLRHPNVIELKSVLMPLDLDSFTELYLVFEELPTDLDKVIRSHKRIEFVGRTKPPLGEVGARSRAKGRGATNCPQSKL